jgi:hypothetical protein
LNFGAKSASKPEMPHETPGDNKGEHRAYPTARRDSWFSINFCTVKPNCSRTEGKRARDMCTRACLLVWQPQVLKMSFEKRQLNEIVALIILRSSQS